MLIQVDRGEILQAGRDINQQIEAGLEGNMHFIAERTADLQRGGIERLATALGALSNIELNPEKPLLIFGENGAGKSTLTRAISLALDRDVCEAHWASSDEYTEFNGSFYSPPNWAKDVRMRLVYAGLGRAFSRGLKSNATADELMKYSLSDTTDLATQTHYGSETDAMSIAFTIPQSLTKGEELGFQLGHVSRRQGLDQYIARNKRRGTYKWDPEMHKRDLKSTYMIDRTLMPIITVLDEPETGMSPRRHESLANDLVSLNDSAAHLVVATNSLALWHAYQDQDERFTYLDLVK